MDDLMKRLVGMNWNAAHNHLMSMNLPNELRASLAAQAQKLREIDALHNKRKKLTQYQHDEMWHRLLAPLKYDLSNAKVGLKLKPFDAAPERHTAFTEYVTLLEKLLVGLQAMQLKESRKIGDDKEKPQTPAELAAERGLPNKGRHWVDWINDKTKARIEALFDAIPTRAKRPNPFTRRIPPDMFKREREALQKRTLGEMDIARQEIALLRGIGEGLTPEQTFRLRELEDELVDMGNAMLHLSYLMRNEPVPHTWRGLDRRPIKESEFKLKNRMSDAPGEWDVNACFIYQHTVEDQLVWTPELEQYLRKHLQEPASKPLGNKSKRPKRYKK